MWIQRWRRMARWWSCCAAPRRTGDSWTSEFDEFGRDKRRVLQACDLYQSELHDLTEGLEKTSSTSFWNLSEIILAKKIERLLYFFIFEFIQTISLFTNSSFYDYCILYIIQEVH